MREGFTFQAKLVIQGHCRVLGQNFKAITLPLSTYAKQNCTPICQPTSPLTIAPPSLTDGKVGTPFSLQLNGNGGASPYVFTLLSGSLPTGLTLGDFGLLSGIPTVAGTSTFTVKVRDQFGTTGTRAYSMTVLNACNWAPVLPLLVAPAGGNPSVNPPWNGIFNLTDVWNPPDNWPFWYFTNQSILGLQVAASDLADYPSNPAWKGELMTEIYWDGSSSQWWLLISFPGIIGTFWDGIGASVNILDPTGIYTYNDGTSVGIATLKVSLVPGGYCVSLI